MAYLLLEPLVTLAIIIAGVFALVGLMYIFMGKNYRKTVDVMGKLHKKTELITEKVSDSYVVYEKNVAKRNDKKTEKKYQK